MPLSGMILITPARFTFTLSWRGSLDGAVPVCTGTFTFRIFTPSFLRFTWRVQASRCHRRQAGSSLVTKLLKKTLQPEMNCVSASFWIVKWTEVVVQYLQLISFICDIFRCVWDTASIFRFCFASFILPLYPLAWLTMGGARVNTDSVLNRNVIRFLPPQWLQLTMYSWATRRPWIANSTHYAHLAHHNASQSKLKTLKLHLFFINDAYLMPFAR